MHWHKIMLRKNFKPTPLDLDPAIMIPQCKAYLEALVALQTKNVTNEMESSEFYLDYLKRVIDKFKDKNLITSERVALALCILDIVDVLPELYAEDIKKFRSNVEAYLSVVLNVKTLDMNVREAVKASIKIDPNYLPDQLPNYLSNPDPKSNRQAFLKRRIAEHLMARIKGNVLKLEEQQLWSEAIAKEGLTFFRSGKAKALNSKNEISDYDASLLGTYESLLEDTLNDKEAIAALDKVHYLNERERDAYRVFIHHGQFKVVSFDETNDSQPIKSFPANTADFLSHEKDGYACFVINGRGEMFMGNHIEDVFNHGSFMSGGDVLFAGEIKINAQGEIVEITAYSGHYQPDVKAMYRLYEYLTARGVDLSHCTFSLLNKENARTAFKKACDKDPTLYSKVVANDPSVLPITTKCTNDSMDRLSVTELLKVNGIQYKTLSV